MKKFLLLIILALVLAAGGTAAMHHCSWGKRRRMAGGGAQTSDTMNTRSDPRAWARRLFAVSPLKRRKLRKQWVAAQRRGAGAGAGATLTA